MPDAFDAATQGDAFDQHEAQQPLSLLQRLGAAVRGGVGDYASSFPEALKVGAQAVGAGVVPSAKAAVQPFRNIGAMGERLSVDPLVQSQGEGENLKTKAAQLEQPLPGAATGTMGNLLQVPGFLAAAAISPETVAAQQLQQGGHVTSANALGAAFTLLGGKAIAPAARAAERLIPFGGRAVNVAANLGVQGAANLLSGRPMGEGQGLGAALGALGSHGDAFDKIEAEHAPMDTGSTPPMENRPAVEEARPGNTAPVASPKVGGLFQRKTPSISLDENGTAVIPPRPVEAESGPFSTETAKAPPKEDTAAIEQWQALHGANQEAKFGPASIAQLSPDMMRRRGAVQLPTGEDLANAAKPITGNIKTNEEIRRTLGTSEFAAHVQAGRFEPHREAAAALTPEERQHFVDTVETSGESPYPALQKLVDENRKTNLEEIEQQKAMGDKIWTTDESAKHTSDERDAFIADGGVIRNPDHISFMAKPTNRYGGGTKNLQGLGGDRYNRESETRAEFENKIANSNGGLELAHQNIAQEIQAGHADVAKSLAFRKSFQDREANGGAIHVPEKGTVPDGWGLAPDVMSNDKLINTKPGTKLALPVADAKALENFQNSGKTGVIGRQVNRVANGMHYLFDLVTPARGLNAEIGNLIESAARGNFSDLNSASHWKQGYDLMTKSIDGLREDPITRKSVEGLQYMSEKGGFRFEGKNAKDPTTLEKINKYNPLDYVKRAADPLKISTVARTGQYALEKVNSGAWTEEEGERFATAQRKVIDSLFGHGKNVDTHNPEATAYYRFFNPLHEWTTGAIKQVARGGAETITAKGNINKTSVPKLLANVTAAIATTGLTGMAMSKYYGGKTLVPHTLADMGKTGRKNPDGSDERVLTASMFLPLFEAIGMAVKGDPSGAAKKLLLSNPLLQPIAESIAGYDFHGNRIEGFMDKAQHAIEGAAPLIGRNADQSVNPMSFLGVRNSPEELEDTPFQREAKEGLKQIHTSLTPDEQAQEDQKFQWMDKLSTPEAQEANGDAAVKEMQDAGYRPEQIRDVFNSALRGRGAASAAERLEPGQLVTMWNSASPQEQAEMLPVLTKRWEDADKDKMTPLTQKAWGNLFDKISPAKTAPTGDAFDQLTMP